MDEERKLREILMDSPVGISIVARDPWERLFVNARMLELLGPSTHKGPKSFVHPEEFEIMMRPIREGKVVDSAIYERRRVEDGRIWWSIMHARPIVFEGRDAEVIWLHDITKRKQVEIKLKQLMSAQSDWLWEIDENLRVVEFSDNFHKISGFTVAQIKGLSMREFGDLTRADPNIFGAFLADLDARRPVKNLEMCRGNGSDEQWVRLNAAPVWEGETFKGYFGSTKNITDLRKAQNRLVITERAVALGGMVAGVAHEINTPLGIAVTALSVLEAEFNAIKLKYEAGEFTRNALEAYFETCEEGIGMLSGNLRRAAELVQNFKQVAVDQSSDAPRKINLYSYIQQVVFNLAPKWKSAGHEVSIEGDQNIVTETYPGAIGQIITNLVENSLVHGFDEGAAGHLKISVTVKVEEIQIDYADNGKGMGTEIVQKIFEPFFTTARGRGGSGLGMHIIQNLVMHRLNGSIDCTSQIGQGMSVKIKFPRFVGQSEK